MGAVHGPVDGSGGLGAEDADDDDEAADGDQDADDADDDHELDQREAGGLLALDSLSHIPSMPGSHGMRETLGKGDVCREKRLIFIPCFASRVNIQEVLVCVDAYS